MKALSTAVLAVVLTVGATAFACGGGSPVTMTVTTNATFDAAPANYTAPTEGSSDCEVM
jgi:hypothetical protein